MLQALLINRINCVDPVSWSNHDQITAQFQAMYNSKIILQKRLRIIHSVKYEYLIILKDKSNIILYFHIVNKSSEKTRSNNELIRLTRIVCVSKAWNSLFLCDIELHYCVKIYRCTGWHVAVISYYDEHCTLDAVVYIELIPHTLSCCCKYSPEHHMCIDLQLEIVPNKCHIYSCFSPVWKLQLFWRFLKIYSWSVFKRFTYLRFK